MKLKVKTRIECKTALYVPQGGRAVYNLDLDDDGPTNLFAVLKENKRLS